MEKSTIKWIVSGVAIFILIILVINLLPFGIIQAGDRGVVFNNFSGIEKGRILPEGTYWRTPFVESVISLPVRTQKSDFNEQAGTKDSQIVNTKITVNWHLDPGKVDRIYDQLGGSVDTIQSTVFDNNVKDSVKAAVSHYEALIIQRNRDNVTAEASVILQKKVKQYNIIVDGVTFTDISFSDQFTKAIEDAQEATQRAVQAENQEKVAIANKVITETNADAQAYQQKALQQTLTPLLVESKLVDGLSAGKITLPHTLILGNGGSLSQFLLSLPPEATSGQ